MKQTFEDEFERLKHMVVWTPLKVLVWGPGPAATRVHEKRVRIRDLIRDTFPNADVRFSEDLPAIVDDGVLSQRDQELWHLAACDLCVVLDVSEGPSSEIATYCDTRDAYKLFILTPDRYRDSNSFPADLRKHKVQAFFSDQEFDECKLVEKAVERARQIAMKRYMNGL
jgi:hypothetical protein